MDTNTKRELAILRGELDTLKAALGAKNIDEAGQVMSDLQKRVANLEHVVNPPKAQKVK